MKLQYTKHERYSLGGAGYDTYPELKYITTIDDFLELLKQLFVNDKYYNCNTLGCGKLKKPELCDNGKKLILRADFWRGAFNEIPIHFELESDYSKKFETQEVVMNIIAALTQNRSYFLLIEDGDIKIDKTVEVM